MPNGRPDAFRKVHGDCEAATVGQELFLIREDRCPVRGGVDAGGLVRGAFKPGLEVLGNAIMYVDRVGK